MDTDINMEANMMKRGVLVLTVSSLIFMLSGYVINVWLGRSLGPQLYGIYGVLTALLTGLNIMQVSGVPQSVSKFVAESEERKDDILKSAISIQIITTLFFSLIFLIFAPLLAGVFHDAKLTNYIRMMSLVFPLYGLFALYGGYYNGQHNFKRQSIIIITYSTAKAVLILGLVGAFSLYGVIMGFVIAPLIALVVGFHWPKGTKTFSYRKLIFYSLPLMTYALFSTLQITIDLFAIKSMVGDAEIAGYYAATQSIALITFFGMNALGQVLFPQISRLNAANKHHEAGLVISSSLRNLLLFLLPLTALIAGSAPTLIKLLFGNSYMPATSMLRVLVTSYVFITIFAMFANILNGAGRAKVSTALAGTGLVVGFIGCILLIPLWGALGAATATGIGGVLVCAGAMKVTSRMFNYSLAAIKLIRILIASMVILGLAWVTTVPPLLLPIWWLFLGAIYVFLLFASREININDWRQVRDLLPKRFLRIFVK